MSEALVAPCTFYQVKQAGGEAVAVGNAVPRLKAAATRVMEEVRCGQIELRLGGAGDVSLAPCPPGAHGGSVLRFTRIKVLLAGRCSDTNILRVLAGP